MTDHFKDMMADSLGLEEPWHVVSAAFDPENRQVDVHVSAKEGAALHCPRCGGKAARYGCEADERTWRHCDCMSYPTVVHCKRLRVRCPHCGIQLVGASSGKKRKGKFQALCSWLRSAVSRPSA